jgi:GDP-L-fucose synthase
MQKNSKIYIAGHNGLVGSAIKRKLLELGYSNIVSMTKKELDLRGQLQTKQFFELEKPDYVFLAAAKVGGIKWNQTNPADFIYDNLTIQTNVIDAAYKSGVKKLLFLGSACIYPKITPQPIKEDQLLTAPLEPTNEAYAIAKIAGLKLCESYKKQYNFDCINLMPTNLYGPGDNFMPDQCHVIPGLIKKFSDAKRDNKNMVVAWGDGSPTREFLYVDDLADACVYLMNTYDKPEHINVGSDTEISIKELSEIIKNKVGFSGEILWDTSMPNGTPKRKIDNSKLFATGWRPKVSFEEGITRTVEWYKKNVK